MIDLDQIFLGDCLKLLDDPDLFSQDSIDCCITSPPYFQQRGYNGIGIGNEAEFVEYRDLMVKVFGQCLRLIKPQGTLVFNLGDKYDEGNLMLAPYRVAIAIQDAYPSVRLINNVTWIKTNPTPRQDSSKLTSSTEPFFVFAKSKDTYFNKKDFCFDEEDNKPVTKVSDRVGQTYHTQIDRATALSDDEKRRAHVALDATIEAIKAGEIKGLRMKLRGVHALADRKSVV